MMQIRLAVLEAAKRDYERFPCATTAAHLARCRAALSAAR